MRSFYRRIAIALLAALVGIAGYIWWQSMKGAPGDIPMGDDSSTAEIISLVMTVIGALTAIVNLLIAIVKLKSEKEK